ncbi:MAG: SecD/SecF family protein translocase subunit [Pirellulaceae bacterium]
MNILKSGRLPGTLMKNPVSKDSVDSNIGRQLQESGLFSIGLSFVAVIVFMAIYYMRAGIIACLVLLINVSLIVSLTMLIKFPFSLTSLAGLVLTVGMSVDANVLIFERIREELTKGSTLRMAIQNGFSRAMSTIIDANLTTLLTAVVLYLIGTEHIRGFAVTLILGIVMSLFTAIFCARVMFEIAEKQRWLGQLKMMQVFDGRLINFGQIWPKALGASVIMIALGLVGVGLRGSGILSHDLQGGTSARILLTEPMKAEDVRDLLNERFEGTGEFAELGAVETDGVRHTVEVAEVTVDGVAAGSVYRVDTSLRSYQGDGDPPADYPQFDLVLEQALGNRLARYDVAYSTLVASPVDGSSSTDSTSETPLVPPATGTDGSDSSSPDSTPSGTSGEGTDGSASEGSSDPMGSLDRSNRFPAFSGGPVFVSFQEEPTVEPSVDPSGSEPAQEEPATTSPEPASTDPQTTEPQTTEPQTTEPETTETPTTEPETTEPQVTEPETTEPETTEPATTEPQTTEPETTETEVTVPETTASRRRKHHGPQSGRGRLDFA